MRTCDSLRRRFRVRRVVSTTHLAAGPRIQNVPKFSPPPPLPVTAPAHLFLPLFLFLPPPLRPPRNSAGDDEGRRDTTSGSAATFQRSDKEIRIISCAADRDPVPRRARHLPRSSPARSRRPNRCGYEYDDERAEPVNGLHGTATSRGTSRTCECSQQQHQHAETTSDIRSGSET